MAENMENTNTVSVNKISGIDIKDNVGYDMSRVHRANLTILKEIDRICRKYKIQYALDAGTLIGAVRHKGFIPWDDDADIVFTRNQFEAFKKVVKRELPDTMELVEPDRFHDRLSSLLAQAPAGLAAGHIYTGRLHTASWICPFLCQSRPLAGSQPVAALLRRICLRWPTECGHLLPDLTHIALRL